MIAVHIFLVGMAGSGKSSLGSRLAASLGLPFVDTDQRVSQMMNMDLQQIRAQLGESFLENADTGVLMSLIDEGPSVVSTSSTLPLAEENVRLMKNHGVIIHIDRPLDQILAEQLNASREGLDAASREEIVALYNQRIGYYRACADYSFANDHGFVVGAQGLIALVEGLFPPG